jgi:hypothetical protein
MKKKGAGIIIPDPQHCIIYIKTNCGSRSGTRGTKKATFYEKLQVLSAHKNRGS